MRSITFATLLLLAPLVAFAATPAVTSGTINYGTNQVTLIGLGFEPAKAAPTVTFDGAALTVNSFSNTQIVATLPTGIPAGTFDLTIKNSQGNSSDFDLTYGATGPQGPAGPAGPTGAQGPIGPAGVAGATGPQGPRGLTGAPGAPGPAGANGTGFTFLNAFDAYATYASDSVVTYNGSSYVAIVPNGPSPYGPTPDQNPSWSKMAAAGATGATGPTGPQGPLGDPGPQGLMGNPGPAGATGPAGPQGSAGGVLSYAANQTLGGILIANTWQSFNSIVLANIGTYVLGGQQKLQNRDPVYGAIVGCQVLAQNGNGESVVFESDELVVSDGFSGGTSTLVTVPLNWYYRVTTAPTTINVECSYNQAGNQPVPTNIYALDGSITAIQVQ